MDIVAIVLEILVGLIFLMAGSSKVFGSQMQVDSFNHLKLPQWFRVVTGLTQYVGVIAIVIGFWVPSWSAAAGIWLAIVMLFATIAHLRVKDTFKQTFPAVVIMVLAILIFALQASDLSQFPG